MTYREKEKLGEKLALVFSVLLVLAYFGIRWLIAPDTVTERQTLEWGIVIFSGSWVIQMFAIQRYISPKATAELNKEYNKEIQELTEKSQKVRQDITHIETLINIYKRVHAIMLIRSHSIDSRTTLLLADEMRIISEQLEKCQNSPYKQTIERIHKAIELVWKELRKDHETIN